MMLDSLDTLIAFIVIMLVVSLLITITVQMAAAALNVRGLNLAQGLKRSFAVIVPATVDLKSEENAKKLANFILKGRFLSDSFLPAWPIFSFWRHTTAIRPEEVFDAVRRIAIGKEPVGEHVTVRESARRLLVALGVDGNAIDQAAQDFSSAEQSAAAITNDLLQLLPAAEQSKAQEKLQLLTNRLKTANQAVATQITGAEDAIEAARKKFVNWTCISQERAQQWVTMHTRILTVIFALLAAFCLQLDTVEIFRHVSSDKSARDKLVAQSAAVASQAERAFRDSNSVLQKAYEAWPDRTNPAVQAAVATIKVEPNETRESLIRRLSQALASLVDHNAYLKSFNDTVDQIATDTLKEKAGDYTAVKADFDKAGFDLFPASDKGRWGYGRWPTGDRDHIWGILFSVGLLSLGAPFWYHSLKNLTSLRSTVAQNIAEEKDAAQQTAATRA